MIRFTFRSDHFKLPDPESLFELCRMLLASFEHNPLETYSMISNNIVAMGQLQAGLFFSFKEDPHRVITRLKSTGHIDQTAKLEMSWPIPNMIRVSVTNRGFLITILPLHSHFL